MTKKWHRKEWSSPRREMPLRLLLWNRQEFEEPQCFYGPIEIGSSINLPGYPKLYLPVVGALIMSGGDPQSEVGIYQPTGTRWSYFARPTRYPNPSLKVEEDIESQGADHEFTAGRILANLADPGLSRDVIRKSILEAEVVSFGASQVNILKPLLRRYIEEHRDSTDSTDLVAVASAVRKYVGIVSCDEISSVAFILEAGHKAPVPIEVELEVAKMVVRKLTAVRPPEPSSLPELVRQLMELARTYLTPRLLARQYYGAIAVNSVLALTLLDAPGLSELFEIVRRLPVPWFKQLVIRRADALMQEFAERCPADEADLRRERLGALVGAVQQEP